MHIRRNIHKAVNQEGKSAFDDFYDDISRGRDIKAARLQERRWHRLHQLGY